MVFVGIGFDPAWSSSPSSSSVLGLWSLDLHSTLNIPWDIYREPGVPCRLRPQPGRSVGQPGWDLIAEEEEEKRSCWSVEGNRWWKKAMKSGGFPFVTRFRAKIFYKALPALVYPQVGRKRRHVPFFILRLESSGRYSLSRPEVFESNFKRFAKLPESRYRC